MEQKYLVSLVDGIKFFTTDVNLSTLNGLMNQNKILAVKIGGKTFTKQLIGFVAKAESIETANKNVVLKINNELLFVQSENVDAATTDLTDSLNKKAYVLFDGVLFNRSLFQYAEPFNEEVPEA
ncbi:hypothetical protein ACTHOQ_09445 [Solibacillus silvestris]|uniref:hypothetical protein n=1 Tax=Solibacillus silvestris TaxID=76853 RepID=UPI003F814509